VVDDAIMRFTEFFRLCLLLARRGAGGDLLASIGSIVVAIAIVSWPPVARVIRAEFLSLRSREFVHAAEVLGRCAPRSSSA
jgi:peptide/nickel transport system permease protein